MGSFLKGRPRLQSPAQHRYLLGTHAPRRKLFERAEANTVGLAQGTVDGAGFGHAHLGVVEDQGRNVSWMGITIPDEPATLGRFIDCGLEHPKVLLRTTQREDRFHLDARAVVPHGHSEQVRVGYKVKVPWMGSGDTLDIAFAVHAGNKLCHCKTSF